MRQKPRIGITLDWEDAGGFARTPWYAVRQNYCTAISAVGGVPFPLPHEMGLIEDYLNCIDGLLVTGGGHDVDPHWYGESYLHPSMTLKPERVAFEMAITKGALERNMPFLGICGGQQLLNVALGGTLIQHLPDIENILEHKMTEPVYGICHSISLKEGTLLHRLMGVEKMEVNSFHHQAIKTIGEAVVINALAPDGIIEGIESPKYRFCLGVQWHPECTILPEERNIFEAFVHASGR